MPYTVSPTPFPEVLILKPNIFEDDRGFFYESHNKRDFEEATGLNVEFVQDNHSRSAKGVLRGLHYQIQHSQGKLARVTHGSVFDVAVDIRRSSPNYGKWFGTELSSENKLQMWIPEGFAHGFLVTSDKAEFLYKTTDYWFPEHERSIIWNDQDINILWPLDEKPSLAGKDESANHFKQAECFK